MHPTQLFHQKCVIDDSEQHPCTIPQYSSGLISTPSILYVYTRCGHAYSMVCCSFSQLEPPPNDHCFSAGADCTCFPLGFVAVFSLHPRLSAIILGVDLAPTTLRIVRTAKDHARNCGCRTTLSRLLADDAHDSHSRHVQQYCESCRSLSFRSLTG